ncbi:MAG: hypothetical protein KIS92_23025, partial [Planctomycetota bacterium]|nr:hypothetical protein [Planctomycetota bacterium]
VLDRHAGAPVPALASPPKTWRGTLRGELDETMRCNDLEWAWYDGTIYVSSPARIEALTLQERGIKAGPWVDTPLNPDWANAVKHLAEVLRFSPDGCLTTRNDLPVLVQDVRLLPDHTLSYRADVAGERRLHELFDLLQNPAAESGPATAVLNEQRVTGVIRDCAQLAQQAGQRNVRVVVKQDLDFPAQCFVARNTPLGLAFEWAARMQGQGLRNDAGALVMDTLPACYGPQEIRVIGLQEALKLAPADERILPQALIRHVKAWYPDLFAGVECHPVRGRIVLVGDMRHVFAVQRVRDELCADLRKAREKNQPLDVKAWKPAWREDLEKNLAEPFRGDGSGQMPAGTFVYLLRQSGQFTQVRDAMLAEPGLMRARAARAIPALDVKGKTLGEALAALAEAAGARLVVEDEALWFRAAR